MNETTPAAIREEAENLETKTKVLVSSSRPDLDQVVALKLKVQDFLDAYRPLVGPSSSLRADSWQLIGREVARISLCSQVLGDLIAALHPTLK